MVDGFRARDPDADGVARRRGLAASHQARRDAESGAREPFWLHCSYEQFYRYLLQIETEKGIRHADPNA